MDRDKIKAIADETLKITNVIYKDHRPPDSIKMSFEHRNFLYLSANSIPAIVDVVEMDTADRGRELGPNTMILNMASHKRPGGGWLDGVLAQEESLFLRSTYSKTLNRYFYPLLPNVGIYSHEVIFFRENQFNNFQLLPKEKYFMLSAVAVPAIANPVLVNGKFSKKDEEITRKKIEGIFITGIRYGHQNLVLGAWGSGAFGNPPEIIAQLFAEYVEKFKYHFAHISFAVIDPPDRYGRKHTNNYEIFKKIIMGDKK